jgi:hypothetical protein
MITWHARTPRDADPFRRQSRSADTPIRLQNVTPRLAYLNSYLLA